MSGPPAESFEVTPNLFKPVCSLIFCTNEQLAVWQVGLGSDTRILHSSMQEFVAVILTTGSTLEEEKRGTYAEGSKFCSVCSSSEPVNRKKGPWLKE